LQRLLNAIASSLCLGIDQKLNRSSRWEHDRDYQCSNGADKQEEYAEVGLRGGSMPVEGESGGNSSNRSQPFLRWYVLLMKIGLCSNRVATPFLS